MRRLTVIPLVVVSAAAAWGLYCVHRVGAENEKRLEKAFACGSPTRIRRTDGSSEIIYPTKEERAACFASLDDKPPRNAWDRAVALTARIVLSPFDVPRP